MHGLRAVCVFAIFSFVVVDGYGYYKPTLLDSLRMYQDSLRNKRKIASVAKQDQDLLASYFMRRRAVMPAKRSKTIGKQDNAGATCSERSKITYTSPNTARLDIRFPSVHTTKDDTYMCTGYKVPFEGRESFIVKFTPHADMDQTHHMLVYGCAKLYSDKPAWECHGPCADKKILYAWARNAPEMALPKDVGFSIGKKSGINYIGVEMHFAKTFSEESCAGVSADITTIPQKNFAGIYLIGGWDINLPPHSVNVPVSAACLNMISDPLHVFAFRTHAHMHANVITGYRLRKQDVKMIGKGNPKWPQSFYPRVGGEIVLQKGDVITAQCIYNNTENKVVSAGSTGADEMCNLYLMFYASNKDVMDMNLECWGLPHGVTEKDFILPASVGDMPPYPGYAGADSINAIDTGSVPVPPVPPEHIHQHHGAGEDHDEDEESLEEETEEAEGDPMFENPNIQGAVTVTEKKPKNESRSRGHGMPKYQGLQAEVSYPEMQHGYSIGAVGGLVAAPDGSVYVFHRAGREWTALSFDSHNRFLNRNSPITKDTVYHLDKNKGNVLHSWGKDMFFMPHGASLDHEGYLWLTDVAMHQVFKFPPEGAKEPLLTLGTRLVPGSDVGHFCKPTDVAVDSDGMIYVSDGYCNGRVMKFSPDGSFVTQWGRMITSRDLMPGPPPPYAFFIAHSIILCGADQSELCVADRENGRIQCFTKKGQLTRIISDPRNTGSRIFAVTYSPLEGGLLYGVSGPVEGTEDAGGFTMHYDTGVVMRKWQPSPDTPLLDPHDISASPSGHQVYVGDLTHKKIFKFSQTPSAQENVAEDEPTLPSPPLDGDGEQIDKKSGSELEPLSQDEIVHEEVEEDVGVLPAQNDKEEIVQEVREFPDEEVSSSGIATVIVICLVVLPTVSVLTAFICIRVRANRLKEYESLLHSAGKSKSLNIGKFLSPTERKGFQRVSSEGSDDESDVEVYSKKVEDEENSVQ